MPPSRLPYIIMSAHVQHVLCIHALRKQQDINQNRAGEAKIWVIERRGLSRILLHKIAGLPAACVNISLCVPACVCVCVCVCPVYAECSEQMTGMTVRTCAMVSTQRLTQLNLLSVEPEINPVGECCQLCSPIWPAVVCATFAAHCWFL